MVKDGVDLKIFIYISLSCSSDSSPTYAIYSWKITGYTIKAAKSANKVPRNPCFFISHLRLLMVL